MRVVTMNRGLDAVGGAAESETGDGKVWTGTGGATRTGARGAVAATVLGAVFLVEAHRLLGRARGSEELSVINPMRLFHASNLYLSLLFVAVALDPLLLV